MLNLQLVAMAVWSAVLSLLLCSTAVSNVRGFEPYPPDCKIIMNASDIARTVTANGNNVLTFCLQECALHLTCFPTPPYLPNVTANGTSSTDCCITVALHVA